MNTRTDAVGVLRRLLSQREQALSWARWQPMEDLHHYGADGNLVPGPHPDWHKVEYAYAPPAAADGRTNEEKK